MSDTVMSRPRTHGLPRFLLATFVVALLYVGLQEAWLRMFGLAAQQDRATWLLTGSVQDEAERIAKTSAAGEARLTSKHRWAAFALGYRLGFVAETVGSMVGGDPSSLAKMRRLAVPLEQASTALAAFLGAGDATPLAMNSGIDFMLLSERIEADENGLAARVEAATTPRHKQLYLLGAHVGVASARIEILSGKGIQLGPLQPRLIARHAVLAGVPEPLWRPLAVVPRGKDPGQVAGDYRTAVIALDRALGDPRVPDAERGR